MLRYFISGLLLFVISSAFAQTQFPDKCAGEWEGKMFMYNEGVIVDTVDVSMFIEYRPDSLDWTWKTVYNSAKYPQITKDYKLIKSEEAENKYILDENNGILLYSYVFDNKMYSAFEVMGSLLNSVYILNEDELIFEITSGKDIGKTGNDITNFSVMNLQRSILKRKNK